MHWKQIKPHPWNFHTIFSIGIGSKTSTGGVVIEGNEGLLFDGLVASSVGHKATCPACKKGAGEIIAVGSRTVYLPAGPAARAGDYIACGCPPGLNTLIAQSTISIASNEATAPNIKKPLSSKLAASSFNAPQQHATPNSHLRLTSYAPEQSSAHIQKNFNCRMSDSNDIDSLQSGSAAKEIPLLLKSKESRSGFEIDQEGATKIYRKLGLNNIPDISIINMDGIHLADEMITAAIPADELIGILEPSPTQRLKPLSIIIKILTNTAKQDSKTYWHDEIENISIGMGSRAGIQYSYEFMSRYRALPR